ncbi:MAG: serine/threonine-protein kinase [Candidatus Sulfomarinibacteraceae bacterium]
MTEETRSIGSGSGNPDDPGSDPPAAEHDETISSSSHEDSTIGMPTAGPRGAPVPESIGGYRIVGVLGEGGMGIVYEAEQSSPRRRVALKVIRGGHFVDEAHIKMFQREAETLARLKHPNIGAIYESGRTDEGHHFFAMELVRGETLDRYLARRSGPIDPAELDHRLELFRKVCDAVQYAHQRGVIHRDLKPSNIIVTDELSSSGASIGSSGSAPAATVKILDFGLARITEEDIAMTQITEIGVIKGTLPYMAPEQAKGDGEAIDIRTDVYALGVILYEMLAGRRPYDTARSGILEAVRVICEEPPAPLSATWSGTRKLDPDVETIVGTALEKEPERRYASAAALSEDVGRFLESQPILARPPSAVYQLRKMVNRHRTAFAASVAVVAVLVVSSVVSTSLFFTAKRESERARVEALKSDQVAAFMAGMLEGVGPAVALGRDTTMLREILDDTAERIGSELREQPEVEAQVRIVLGTTYRDLGELEEAETQHRRALEISRRTLGDDHRETLIAMNNLGLSLHKRGKHEEAEPLYREALSGMRRLLGDDDRETLTVVGNLGQLIYNTGRLDEAEPYHIEALEGCRRVEGPEHPDTLTAETNLGVLLHAMGRVDEAETVFRSGLATKRRALGDDHPQTLININSLAVALEAQGRYDEAEQLYLEGLEGYRRVMGESHPETLSILANLGVFMTRLDRIDEAERYLTQALETRRRVLGDDHFDTLLSMNTVAFWYYRQGRIDECEALLAEAIERGRRVMGNDHPDLLVWIYNMGTLYQIRNRPAEAEPLIREAMDTRRRVLGPAHPETLRVVWDLAEHVDGMGRPEEAEQLLLEGLEDSRRDNGEAHPLTTTTRSNLAAMYSAHGRMDEARLVASEKLAALRGAAEAAGEPGPKNAFAREALTCEPADLQDPEAALAFALEAVELGEWQDPNVIYTLAVAYHRTGDTERAIEVSNRALELIPEEDTGRRQAFEARLAEYRAALEGG